MTISFLVKGWEYLMNSFFAICIFNFPPSRHTKKFCDITDAIPVSLHFVDNTLQFNDHWALIHWPPDSSELFRCDGAIAVFSKQRGSFHDFSSAFFSQLLAVVWAKLRKTDRGGGCPSAGTLISWSSLQCLQCAGCAVRQSPPVLPPDRITFACVLSPRSDQAS